MEEKGLNHYSALVKIWAEEKGILKSENARNQMLKVFEEVGELSGSIAKNKPQEDVIDAIGDSFVTLIILSYQLGLEPSECLRVAYEVIAKRKGTTVNGVFIKE